MVEIRRGAGGDGGAGGGERLPWLEPVEDEDGEAYGPGPSGGGYGGVVLAAFGVLVAIGLVTAGVAWFRHHQAARADLGETIRAEPGPYKVKPENPGGLHTDEVGQVTAITGAGQDIDAQLDPNAVSEQPMVARGKVQAQPAPAPVQATPVAAPLPPPAAMPKPAEKAAAPATVEKPERPAGAGGTVQLGAFSSEAKAKAAWKVLAARFPALRDMTPDYPAVESGETKLFRLRASGGTEPASRLCARMKIAGETCAVIGGG